MNLLDFEFYAPVYIGIFINLIVISLLAYQCVIVFFIHRKTNFDYAKPLLFLCATSMGYGFLLIYPYFGILMKYNYQLAHATLFLGMFSNTLYINTLSKYTKAPKAFTYYQYCFIGFCLLTLGVFWQSIFTGDDTLFYDYGPSPSVPYVGLVARDNGIPNPFCTRILGLVGLTGSIFSLHMVYHVLRTSKDKWIILGVILNLILGIHDIAWGALLLYNTFPLMSLSFVVEIMRMSFQMQNAAAKWVDKLEDEVGYLTQVAKAGFAVGQICHDIRNPITVIKGHNQIIVSSLENPGISKEIIKRSTDKITKSSERISMILDSYLSDIYHTSDDEFTEIRLNKLIGDVIEICSEKTKTSKIDKISCECPDSEFIYGIENQLVMAFVNILSNSCDAIETLEQRWINITCIREDSNLAIRFTDSGSGISKQLEPSIFERSFTTKEKGKGTGLGLSFVKKVVEAHHGSIYIDHKSKNTCFVVTLPEKNKVAAVHKIAV